MKKRLLIIGSAVCFAVLLTVSAFALGGTGDPPPMNGRGFISLALMSGALAFSVGIVVHYAQKFRDINREQQRKPPQLQNKSPQKKKKK